MKTMNIIIRLWQQEFIGILEVQEIQGFLLIHNFNKGVAYDWVTLQALIALPFSKRDESIKKMKLLVFYIFHQMSDWNTSYFNP